ncbi:MAG: DHA2 family efflux MFS transporter permease subunit, partial [Acetobacteraceae bacterium]
IVLDRFDVDDGFGSSFIVGLSFVAVVCLVTLVVWELVVAKPIINLRLFAVSRAFSISCGLMFLVGLLLLGTTQLLPQLTQVLMDYSAYQAGLTLGIGGLATIIMMPLSGIVTGRLIQPKWLIAAALIGSGWGIWRTSGLDLDASLWTISQARMLQVLWLPFLFIPITAVSYFGVPADQNNQASALINLTRNLGGSFGISGVQTLLSWRTQFHHARLAESVTPYNGYGFGHSLAAIAHAVQTQAQVMSYLDIF